MAHTPQGFHLVARPSGVQSSYTHLVVDQTGLPHLALTEFFAHLQQHCSEQTPHTYLHVLLPYFTYLATDAWRQERGDHWDSPPEAVREAVRDYLLERLGCKVQRQDLTAYLMVLYAAVQQHGCPRILVSDSGGIFKANQAKRIYKALGIEKRQIERRQSWQDLLESQFNIQRRLADYHWSQAETWEQAKEIHAQWMSDHNYQDHWAHKAREDGRLSPAAVLGWVRGTVWEPERVHRVFFSHQFKRWLDRFGCMRFRHFRLYGEEGLAKENITLWLYGEILTLEFNNTPLTQFQVSYQPDKKRFKEVDFLQRFETQYRSIQASLWEEEEVKWLKVLRLPEYMLRHRQSPGENRVAQLDLFA